MLGHHAYIQDKSLVEKIMLLLCENLKESHQERPKN